MHGESYMAKVRREKREKRTAKIAKIISLLIILGVPLVIGIFIGRATKSSVVVANEPAKVYVDQEEEITTPEYKIPDGCELAVVVCNGEADYEYYE